MSSQARIINGVSNGQKGGRKQSLKGVLQGVLKSLESIDADSFDDEGERLQAVVAAYALVARLETPWEFLARTGMGQVSSPCTHAQDLVLASLVFLVTSRVCGHELMIDDGGAF